jgi:hypothetical protein
MEKNQSLEHHTFKTENTTSQAFVIEREMTSCHMLCSVYMNYII